MYTFNDADASNVQKTPAGTLLTRTSDVLVGNDTLSIHFCVTMSWLPLSPALLEIDDADTRREHKLTAGVSLIR